MKKSTKALLTALCAILLVVTSVMGTLAYLADYDSAVNTFTVGDINILLDETDVDLAGVPDGNTRVQANEYKLIPGHTYIKDPTVTVKADSEECYIRMIVTISDLADVKAAFGTDPTTGYFLPQNFVADWDPAVWETTNVVVEENNTATYEFRYHKTVSTVDAGDLKLEALFRSMTVPGNLTNAQIKALEEMDISIRAEAIQADTFADENAAWAAWESNTVVENDN